MAGGKGKGKRGGAGLTASAQNAQSTAIANSLGQSRVAQIAEQAGRVARRAVDDTRTTARAVNRAGRATVAAGRRARNSRAGRAVTAATTRIGQAAAAQTRQGASRASAAIRNRALRDIDTLRARVNNRRAGAGRGFG